MLIGVAGRRSAGKDSIGAYLVERHGYARYAFADKVKALALHIGWHGEKDEWGRSLLQRLGMGARAEFGVDFWIRRMVDQIWDDSLDLEKSLIVVTDVRLPNEAEWVKRSGGQVWRVTRPDLDRGAEADQHATEAQVDALEVDLDILNDGTLEDLYLRVECALLLLRKAA